MASLRPGQQGFPRPHAGSEGDAGGVGGSSCLAVSQGIRAERGLACLAVSQGIRAERGLAGV